MKKIISLALAAAMAFTMSVAVFAAGSITDLTNILASGVTGATVGSGVSTVPVTELMYEDEAAVLERINGITGSAFETAVTLGTIDLTYAEGATVTVDLGSMVSDGDIIVVWHAYTSGIIISPDVMICTVSGSSIAFMPVSNTGSTTFVKVTGEAAVEEAVGSVTTPTSATVTGATAMNGVPTISLGFDSGDGVDADAANTAAATNAVAAGYKNYVAYALDINFVVLEGREGDATVTVAVDGISAGDSVVVLHYFAKDGVLGWYKEAAEVTSSGQVKISGLTTASPFMIIKATTGVVAEEEEEEESASSSSSTGSSADIFTDAYGYWNADGEFVWYGYFENGVFIYTMDPATVNGTVADAASPKTGEGVAVAVASIAMLFAGVAVCGLTRKEQL